jgi:1,4-dihydroxy-6-naphthoate synthase
MTQTKPLTVGHSPDADDAFMFYGIEEKAAAIPGYHVVHVMQDIQTLNQRARRGELDVTAISAAVYAQVAHTYRILACGASIGRQYGPLVVARQPLVAADLPGKRVAIPGRDTTAYLLMRLYVQGFEPVFLDFDAIMGAVAQGTVEAGLLIHEGQITYGEQQFHAVLDLGKAWAEDTGLPIPLGLDAVHRRLGEEMVQRVFRMLQASILYADAHEEKAVEYALRFGRGMDAATAARFIRMYVNDDTRNMGAEGRQALKALYTRAFRRGLIAAAPALDIVGLAEGSPPRGKAKP